MANRTVTVGTGKDYASLNAALAAEFAARPDLTAAGGVLTIECYFISGGDTTNVSWPAFTNPTATDYIRVVAVDRHSGTWNTTSAYYLTGSASPVLAVGTMYTRVEGLQVTTSANRAMSVQGRYSIADGCIVQGALRQGMDIEYGDVTLKNCLAFDCGRQGFQLSAASGGTAYIYNCTAVDCAQDGFLNASSRALVVTNGLAYNCGDNATYFCYRTSNGTLTLTTCASSDATGTTGLTGIASSVFNNYAGDDFHLAAGSPLIGAGTDLYGSGVTTDIDNATLTVRNDIGADELPVVAAGQPASRRFGGIPFAALNVGRW